MAEKDGRTDEGPSLELPSLGFGRKRGRKDRDAAPEADAGSPAGVEADDRPTEPIRPVAPPPEPAGRPLFADEAPATRVDQAPAPRSGPAEPSEPSGDRPRREFALPSIGTRAGSVVSGLLVGVLAVGATWGGLRLCEVVRGTSSCGKPGFLLLLAIVVALVWIGSMLLRAWGVPDPGSTSFLGVGLLTVLALLFLVDVLFAWWMVIVIPVLSTLTFALAHWVATAFVEVD